MFDEIVAPHRDPAGHDQQIGLKSLFDELAQAARFVGVDGQEHGVAAGLLDLHCERVGVGVANLCGTDFGIDVDDLIAGG